MGARSGQQEHQALQRAIDQEAGPTRLIPLLDVEEYANQSLNIVGGERVESIDNLSHKHGSAAGGLVTDSVHCLLQLVERQGCVAEAVPGHRGMKIFLPLLPTVLQTSPVGVAAQVRGEVRGLCHGIGHHDSM